jgi:hypothetical protein
MGIGRTVWAVTQDAVHWHVRSQEVSRRNAMVASTALTQRRRETAEVEEFLARHRRQHDVRAAAAGNRSA